VIGVATDVTERRRAERLLRESEQRLRTVVSNAPVVLFALDAEGVFTLAEGRALDDLGIDPASIIGRSSEDVYRNAPDMAEATRRALAGEQAAALLETDRLALEARMGPIFGAGGQVLGVIGVATDVSERRRAERALRESEERFRKIFEEGPLGMAIVGPDFRLMRANAKLCDMLGYGEDELTSKTFLEITHPDDTEADAQLAQRVFAGEIPSYNIEKRYLKKDGSILWAALTASVIHDRATNALYGLGMVEDITERKRAEDALRESEERHRWLIESAPDAMVIVNAGGQIEMVNTQAERLFRYARGELIGQPVELLVPEALRTAHAHHRAGYHFEQRSMAEDRANLAGRRKDGSVFPAEISLSPLQTDGGMLVTAAIRDVTERKQAEVALLESETKFRTMAETVAAATFIFQGTKMCYVNSAAEELSGYTRDELLAMDFWDVIHPEFRDLVKERGLRRQLGEEVPPRYEVKLVTKDGEDKWVDFTAGMIDFEGRPAVLGTAFDITERKRVERALHDAASHDPLTGVLNRRAGMAALAERLERARTGSGRYATLVLDLDRFKTINDNYSHETGDSALLLFTSVMHGTVEDAGVICRLGGDEFEIGLDGARLEQALLHAERLQRALRRAQESDDVNCPPFTVSIGIACYPEDGEDVITLGRHADEAMYAAKAAGGNRYRAWRHIRSRAA
jgi:diguanylate cyclase (GGDEF)-like protein/PAS domain S-box-containing protein